MSLFEGDYCQSPIGAACSLLPLLHHGRRLLVNQIDRLEWPKHHPEPGNFALGVPLEHVYAVDADAVDIHCKLQHGDKKANALPDVMKRGVEKHMESCRKVLLRDRFAPLRCGNHWRIKDKVMRKQRVKPATARADARLQGRWGLYAAFDVPDAFVSLFNYEFNSAMRLSMLTKRLFCSQIQI